MQLVYTTSCPYWLKDFISSLNHLRFLVSRFEPLWTWQNFFELSLLFKCVGWIYNMFAFGANTSYHGSTKAVRLVQQQSRMTVYPWDALSPSDWLFAYSYCYGPFFFLPLFMLSSYRMSMCIDPLKCSSSFSCLLWYSHRSSISILQQCVGLSSADFTKAKFPGCIIILINFNSLLMFMLKQHPH